MFDSGQILQERYQLQQQLGNTIAGRQTWLAEDLNHANHELVIVKLLVFSAELHWDDLKLFEREAQVLKNLNHPRIPRYRDYFLVDQQPGSSWEHPSFLQRRRKSVRISKTSVFTYR